MRSRAVFLLTNLLLIAPLLHSQDIQRGPDGSPNVFIPGIDVPASPNLPFTGKDTIAWTRPLTDGGSITTYVEAKIIRDSQGRLYRERHHFAPQDIDPGKTLYASYVSDPIAHTRTTCIYATRSCSITTWYPPRETPLHPAGSYDNGQRFLTREGLGEQTIDNLPVVGTRDTISIAPGVVGNDQTLTLSREFWYSPDLKINMAVTRKDPRVGTAIVHLDILTRAEPNLTVFTIPYGFTVHDDRHTKN